MTEEFRVADKKKWKRNQTTYIKVDSKDENTYAYFSVTWAPGNFNLDKEIDLYTENLKSSYTSKKQNAPVYGEVTTTKFGSNSARQVDYIVAHDGPRIGSYTAFHCNKLTVIIGQHYTAESQEMINRCRRLIEETCDCTEKREKL